MLGNLALHDAVKLFFLLMRISPSFVEVGHKIRPIIHVWGRWRTGHQFVKLLIVPLGCVTDHQGKGPSDLCLSVRHVLDGKVILALPNKVPGFCGGFPCECLWGLHLGGMQYRCSRWWDYWLSCLGHQDSDEISISGGIHIEIVLTKQLQCVCGSHSSCYVSSRHWSILGCSHKPMLGVCNSEEQGHCSHEMDNVVVICDYFHNGGFISIVIYWYGEQVKNRNWDLESSHFLKDYLDGDLGDWENLDFNDNSD